MSAILTPRLLLPQVFEFCSLPVRHWLADTTSIQTVFEISTLLPLMGVLAAFLPKMEQKGARERQGTI